MIKTDALWGVVVPVSGINAASETSEVDRVSSGICGF